MNITQTFCRLCIQTCPVYFSLFDNQTALMLESLTSLKVNLTDTSSKLVCPKCLSELRDAFNMQQKLIKNETLIKEECEVMKTLIEAPLIKIEEENVPKQIVPLDKQLVICSVKTPENKNINVYRIRDDVMVPPRVEKKLNVTANPDLDCVKVEYKCNKCPEIFTVASEYVAHLDSHRTEYCKICQRDIHMDEIKEHCKTHGAGHCTYCGFLASSKPSLQIHINKYHIDPIECEICGNTSYGQKSLDKHMRMCHTGEATHVCEVCGAKFFSLVSVKKHHSSVHLGLKPYKCDECNKRYDCKSKLNVHKRRHSDKVLLICEFCGKGFKFGCNMRTHQKNVHNWVGKQDFQCGKCDKEFSTETALSTHNRKMHLLN